MYVAYNYHDFFTQSYPTINPKNVTYIETFTGNSKHFLLLSTTDVKMILGVFSKLRKAIISSVTSVSPSVRTSVRPHGTTRLLLDGFS